MSLALSIIGGGAMGSALLRGLIQSHLYEPNQVGLSEPNASQAEALAQELGILVLPDNHVAAEAEILILATKPQVFPTIAAQLAASSSDLMPPDRAESQFPSQSVISIMAGIRLQELTAAFPNRSVIRAMPNTPALVGAGMTALCCSPTVTPGQTEAATAIFEAVGSVLWLPESQMDAVTALSGSGPGYIAVIAEALIDGGVRVGLARPVATQLAIQTLLGTATLLQQENLHPAVLKDRVTSPGGTTIAGINALEQGSLRATLMQAVWAAWQRSQELGQL
ncbi:MAG: pyrroline-5-carboxylate reductase [Synechococcaceae cyanobacterium SM2_3_2]|nr:pyrroline-5-carboxylate reductase [Synechococcaceae cyanobacterium SM2_3_2]